MEKEKIDILRNLIEQNKGKRKFDQSVELAINFSGIDFNKQDNRFNLDVRLPNGKGKKNKIIIFADDKTIVENSKKAGADTISTADLQRVSEDKEALREFLKSDLLAQPSLMPQIAKNLGKFLGPRNKMPKPLLGGDIASIITNASNSITLRNKGKYLPTVHCMVGKESMEIEKLAQNIDVVIDTITKKVGRQNLKSVYIKLTMSNPVKLI